MDVTRLSKKTWLNFELFLRELKQISVEPEDGPSIGKELFTRLWRKSLHLIAGIRKSMRNYLMISRKRALIF